jgi:hypothetical protein
MNTDALTAEDFAFLWYDTFRNPGAYESAIADLPGPFSEDNAGHLQDFLTRMYQLMHAPKAAGLEAWYQANLHRIPALLEALDQEPPARA